MDKTSLYLGTSGLQLPVPKRSFPPEHAETSRLGFYATLFNSIEINSSFYKIPQARTLSRWVAESTDGFRFTFKLWKGITHNKGLEFNPEDVATFMDSLAPAENRRGCLLVQLPPSLTVAASPQLEKLLACLGGQWPVAVEFRNRSWYVPDTYDLLDSHNAIMVLHDMPASATPLMALSGDMVYLRFHGPGGRYRGSYPDDFLYEYATYIKEWMEEGKTVYVYFNNTAGDALKNLVSLKGYCS